MNVIWRTLLVIARARRRLRREGPVATTEVGVITLRTLPTDLDLLRHMNNGRYLSLFDLGRWDLLVRTGLFQQMRRRGWYAVVSRETITFRRSLQPWQRFRVQSRLIGHDDTALFLEHRAVVDGEIFARAIIRAQVLRREGGRVGNEEIFAALGRPEGLPEVHGWIRDWAAASALPPSRMPAPSDWA